MDVLSRAGVRLQAGRPQEDPHLDVWGWSPWKNLFFRPPGGVGKGRPSPGGKVFSLLSPPGQPPRSARGVGYLFVVGSGPTPPRPGRARGWGRIAPAGAAWSVRPRVELSFFGPAGTDRRRSNRRDVDWYRRGGWGARPPQFRPRRSRGHGWLAERNWGGTSPTGGVPRWAVVPPPWAVAHHHRQKVGVYRRFRPGGSHLEGVTVRVGLDHLLGHCWPGHPGRGGPRPGYDVHLYEDDHNESFLGQHSDEDYEEWDDVETPYESHSELTYLTPAAGELVALRHRPTLAGARLVVFRRFGSLPLGVFSAGAPASHLGLADGATRVLWPVGGVGHPAFEVAPFLGGYEVPRLFRRLGRGFRSPTGTPAPTGGEVAHPYRDLFLTHRLYEGLDPAGDLLYPRADHHLRDEVYQVGWSVVDGPGRPDQTEDDLDSLEVGAPGWGGGFRSGGPKRYLTSRFRPVRPELVVAPVGGYNPDRYLLGEDLDAPADPVREGLLLEWVGSNYVEGHNLEEFVFQDYGLVDRAPEDALDHPAWGEFDEEVAPAGGDLPPWVVAAALAGAAPGGGDRPGRLTTAPGVAEYVRRGDRAHPVWGRLFYRSPPRGGLAPGGEGFSLGGGIGLRQAARNAAVKSELTHLLTLGEDRLQRERSTAEHLRLWALTEVYFGDTPHGGSLDV